ncbi:hypothetical protein [Actinokineospora iranica]|uniref:Uncharacterized protein n=1 Tax=Actinokineospora iranica TaxID=1271860 RepID=A0A1G6YD26_9PSEU|nr:hypothetical protein [Actinokineospora iranica]SDD88278.1 hypothetical protein SAMN05216174_12121 [Actinokineospora iranica]
MDAEGFIVTPEQQVWLDSLTDEQRRRGVEMLRTAWSVCRMVAEHSDRLADLTVETSGGEAGVGWAMSLALRAEAFRALARGDTSAYEDLTTRANHNQPPESPNTQVRPPAP